MKIQRNLFFAACMLVSVACEEETSLTDSDAGQSTPDAGVSDPDAGRLVDAGAPDAGPMGDAGALTDSGSPEADAGSPDAGPVIVTPRCDSAVNVTAGGAFVGSTMGGSDDYSASGAGCPSGGLGSGNDVAFLIDPPSPAMYRVVVEPLDAGWDPMIYATVDCSFASGCLAGSRFNGAGEDEMIEFMATGPTYVIVDDTVFGTSGSFTLRVSVF